MKNHHFYPVLYTPAVGANQTLERLTELANGHKSNVRRVVICTEDSVSEGDIPEALRNIKELLGRIRTDSPVATYIRPRNTDVLEHLLDFEGIDAIQGFVIPKASVKGFPKFADLILLGGGTHTMMPILEDRRMMDRYYREELRNVLIEYAERIECLRIGGNDLMGHHGMRRDDSEWTIYDGVVGSLIADLVNEFRVGSEVSFTITAPVFECFGEEYDHLFNREARRSIFNQLFGQTVIHPRHLDMLMELYKVRQGDLESAQGMLGSEITAVEGRDGKMDERATHIKWAQGIMTRAEIFGVQKM